MQLQIDKEQKEIKNHGSYEFPLRISHKKLSEYDTGSFPFHWHPEIELTLLLEGEMNYKVNEKGYFLKAGEGLFCNSYAMHSGSRAGISDCHYLSVTFHPRILYGYSSSLMQCKYVNPLLENKALSSILLKPEENWMREILEKMRQILEMQERGGTDREIWILTDVLQIWALIYGNVEHGTQNGGRDRDTERIRHIVEYIQANYTESISLDMLADQVHLCKSETCRMFKRYMNETIFSYLLRYRIERSLEYVKNNTYNITEISEKVGFESSGYFSSVFKKMIGMSPLEYRKAVKSEQNLS